MLILIFFLPKSTLPVNIFPDLRGGKTALYRFLMAPILSRTYKRKRSLFIYVSQPRGKMFFLPLSIKTTGLKGHKNTIQSGRLTDSERNFPR